MKRTAYDKVKISAFRLAPFPDTVSSFRPRSQSAQPSLDSCSLALETRLSSVETIDRRPGQLALLSTSLRSSRLCTHSTQAGSCTWLIPYREQSRSIRAFERLPNQQHWKVRTERSRLKAAIDSTRLASCSAAHFMLSFSYIVSLTSSLLSV
ncbi:unnamed protein product [Protopolystoma xenopodis]|uniref:Uncharacterized protein n=1 Tax=Protopolystoma xenopodis TaxID=117903 RepID=A0A3S5FCP2_9PLAT|nr:unnamed protein product [Protopolystoma xenopodis]